MRTSINITYPACLLAAVLLLTLPLKWLLAALLAAAFHEFCHILAIQLLGGQVCSITVSAGGAKIDTTPLSRGRELICALAGPVGSLSLLLFCRRIPRIALCAGMQAAFNLLPLFPLDGGRILRCTAELLLPPKWAEIVCMVLERMTLSGILILALLGCLWLDLGLSPVIFAGFLLLKAVMRKIPCKEAKLRVQ